MDFLLLNDVEYILIVYIIYILLFMFYWEGGVDMLEEKPMAERYPDLDINKYLSPFNGRLNL